MREILSYSFAIPPTIFIALCLAGALIALARPSIGTKIVLASSFALYVFATPAASTFLLQQLIESIPPQTDFANAQAIVIPGADIKKIPGDSQDSQSIGPITLERLASAAQLYSRLRLPIAVSGGRLGDSPVSLATLMSEELEKVFFVPVRFAENTSRNTFENALFTSRLLKMEHMDTIIVVAQARDMSRALWSFNRAAMHALPYCTDSCHKPASDFSKIEYFLPSAKAFYESYYSIHELIGLAYYKAAY